MINSLIKKLKKEKFAKQLEKFFFQLVALCSQNKMVSAFCIRKFIFQNIKILFSEIRPMSKVSEEKV